MATGQFELQENWLLGSASAFQEDRLGFLAQLAAEGGPVTRFRVGPKIFYFVKDLDLMHEVMVKRTNDFQRGGTIRKILRRTMGEGILVSDGKPWLRQRRMMQPAFHVRQIASYADLMVDHALDVVEQLQPGQTHELRQHMNRLTLGIVTEAMFTADGASKSDVVGDLIDTLQEGAINELQFPLDLPEWFPLPSRVENNKRSQKLRDIIMDIIHARRASNERQDDLLDMLLDARDEETGEGMSDEQVCDEVITIFLAGYDTTALTLLWAFYNLVHNPQVEQKFYDEVDSVLGKRRATLEDLRRLPYTEMIIKETLRLYPPAYFQSRHVYEDTELGGVSIPRHSSVVLSSYATHRRPDLWEDAEAFRPERFADNAEASWHKFKYFPFSHGPHICIGNRFAMMEGVLALATLAQHRQIRLADPSFEIVPQPRVTLQVDEFPVEVSVR